MLTAALAFASLGFFVRPPVAALAVADRFLEAWRTRNVATGLTLAGPRLRRTTKPEELRMALSGLSNPHHWAYEIGDGRTLAPGRVAFHIRLSEVVTGQKEPGSRPDATRLVLTKGPVGWQVDDFSGEPVTSTRREAQVSPDYFDALAEADRLLASRKAPYEVGDGRPLGPGRYAFAVRRDGRRARATRLIVARAKDGAWAVSGQ